MRKAFIRPYVSEEEIGNRNRLFAVAAERNGWKGGKKPDDFDPRNRFFTLLNLRNEKYELRQVLNGELQRWADTDPPTQEECRRANLKISSRQVDRFNTRKTVIQV